MFIGFDASRAFVDQRTGTENYSYCLLRTLSKIDKKNQYLVYIRRIKNHESRIMGDWPGNFKFVEIPLTRLWTQVGLAYRTWVDKLDLLFVPAHTLPIFRKPGLKTVVTIHDLGYEYLPQYHQFPQKYYLNWSTVYAVRQATKLIAVSNATKNDLINKLHCSSEKIEVVYEGVEAERFQKKYSEEKVKEVFGKYGITGDYILSVGTIQPRKNYKRLIEAFAKIPITNNQHPNKSQIPNFQTSNNLQLIIVGKKGWMWEKILAEPKKLGIEERVKFLEYVSDEDLPILYQNAKCFVLPSLYEGFGLPVLEAMAAGCPVIASNSSSLPEVVGEVGILVDPYNIDSMVEGIVTGTSNKLTSDKLERLGLERIKDFSWEKAAKGTLEIFKIIKNNE